MLSHYVNILNLLFLTTQAAFTPRLSYFCCIPHGCLGQTRTISTCTGKTTQKAGSTYSCQAAAVSRLIAIRRTWQRRRRRKNVNIYEGLEIYFFFTPTNRVDGVCSRDGSVSPADWNCDSAKPTVRDNATVGRWADDAGTQCSTLSEHTKYTHTHTHTLLHG